MNFVDQFIDFTKHYESPTSFWRWSAYALVGAIVRDNVWLPQGFRSLYPNMYVLLLADSGVYRKSGSFGPVKSLLSMKEFPGTKVFQGRASIQAIADGLGQDKIDRETSHKYSGGSGIALPEEFAAFFVDDKAVISMLTNMYDYHANFEYQLKSGTVKIKRLCFSILGASNMALLKEVFDAQAVYGGMLARTCIVKPDEIRPPNTLMALEGDFTYERFIPTLRAITALKGPMSISNMGAKTYQDWYVAHYHRSHEVKDITGVSGRSHTNVLKLAMILALSEARMEISAEDVLQAVQEVGKIQKNYLEFTIATGKADNVEIAGALITELLAKPHVVLRDFLLRNWTDTSLEKVNEVCATLEAAGMIQITQVNNEIRYSITDRGRAVATTGKGSK